MGKRKASGKPVAHGPQRKSRRPYRSDIFLENALTLAYPSVPITLGHEEYLHAVRDVFAVRLNEVERVTVLGAELLYGAGRPNVFGTCFYDRWKREQIHDVIEISAFNERSVEQLWETMGHELAHVIAGQRCGARPRVEGRSEASGSSPPHGNRVAHFCYEADRGSMPMADMLKKFRAYYHFIKRQQKHKEAFGIHPIRAVLIETTDEPRARKLMELAQHPAVIGAGQRSALFWFAISPLFTDQPEGAEQSYYLHQPECLFNPIWALPDGSLHRLADAENLPSGGRP